jgi:RNA polymerase sigma-32 factor
VPQNSDKGAESLEKINRLLIVTLSIWKSASAMVRVYFDLLQSEKYLEVMQMRSTSRPGVQPLLRKALSTSKILSAERERDLLMRYHTDNDKPAMDELVRSHMPMIFRIAGGSARNPGVDINDLVQTATEGLLIAINRWSFEKADAGGARIAQEAARDTSAEAAENDSQDGEQEILPSDPPADMPRFSRLATYAMWWMRILLTDSVIAQRGVIVRAKNPKVRKALFSLPMAIKKLDLQLPLAGSDVGRIAAYLGISTRDIEEALIHAAGDVMLDEPVGDGSMLRGEVIADERAEGEDGILSRLASAERWNAVCEALMQLAPRDRFILITRYLLSPKWKLDRLSGTLKMSRERIRQIGVDGLARIRRTISETETVRDQRRPGRPLFALPSLIPLLRGVGTCDNGSGRPGVTHNPIRRSAEAEVAALVEAIERASASHNPDAMAAFLKEQRLTIGPTRIINNRPASVKAGVADEATALVAANGAPTYRCT